MSDRNAYQNAPAPPPRAIGYRDVDSSGWWITVLAGIVLVGVGAWLLSNPFASVVILAWIVGISFVVGGISEVMAHRGHPGEWQARVAGVLLVAGGFTLLSWPAITLWALAVVAGLSLILAGFAEVVAGLADRERSNLALGVLGIALGVVVLLWPAATVVVMALMLGLRAVVAGLIGIGTGWQAYRTSA